VFLSTWKGIGFRPVSLVVGVKHNWGFGHYTRSKQETAYLLAKGRPKKPAAAVADFYAWQRPSLPVHPNEKPLHAITGLMDAFSLKTSRVLDPFAGSGTTLVAARNLGIPAVGIEIYEHYCEVAVKRLSEEVFIRKAAAGQMRLF
jgi:site-specific DNA-methyltransferase (adenine-specific)